ncbi:2-methylcitrate dehydratase PrpD [Kitasatospora sp. MAA4]|uniref:MmgE/PrpD family protein n=1 Tax=Kitasatospora sp. MAA4 TaxID=3035093 RepID=UPI0024744986|nr:MmgE/PrpD family protein [Kitasatospora sp. MAA4]MDH6131844.1 2-methylcitrate dehydratase PrpD [Kitasatospora sp. MAA4]
MTLLDELAAWASALRPHHIPRRVRDLAASQILSQLASIRAGAEHPLGRRMIAAFGPPLQSDPRSSACVLAGLGSWLNLDDTAYAGHLSNSTVAVPVAYARADRLDGAALITAVVAANECAARITAAATLGKLRGQAAVHTHLAGAVAGRLHCQGAPARQWADALSLAYSMPNWPLAPALMGSDARLFNAFTPVRTAMDACDAAAAGLGGAPDILEHPEGFLSRFSSVPLPQAVTAGLGHHWHTETLSFKMHPGGPGIDAAVDCAIELHQDLGQLQPHEIEEIVVDASLYTVRVGQRAARYVTGPGSPLGALVLDTPYTVATALLTGGLTVDDFAAPLVEDPARWQVAARTRLQHDPLFTKALFASEAPFGEALRQAGPAAGPWLREFGGPEAEQLAATTDPTRPDFANSSKATPARVTVHLTDGRAITRERIIPLGGAGPHTRAHHAELMQQKYTALGGDPKTAAAAGTLGDMLPGRLHEWLESALTEPNQHS